MVARCEPITEAVRGRPRTLICEGCGCTNERACPGGCYWISHDPPVCSACADPEDLQADTLLGDEKSPFFGAERCPASVTPAHHTLIWVSETSGYCARCRGGFCT